MAGPPNAVGQVAEGYKLGTVKPKVRLECYQIPRPCVFVSCRYNLYLDIREKTGSIKFNFPNIEPWEMEESCALDIAEDGNTSLEQIGKYLNMSRERARQIYEKACRRLRLKGGPLMDEIDERR